MRQFSRVIIFAAAALLLLHHALPLSAQFQMSCECVKGMDTTPEEECPYCCWSSGTTQAFTNVSDGSPGNVRQRPDGNAKDDLPELWLLWAVQ
jgi:hypothetical protein